MTIFWASTRIEGEPEIRIVDGVTHVGVFVTHPLPRQHVNKSPESLRVEGPKTGLSTSVNSVNKQAEVAYIGWLVLREEIRRLMGDRKALGAKIDRGKEVRRRKVLPGGKVTVWTERVPLDVEELAAARREYEEVSEWIAQLQSERRANAYLAGDMIPEIDRANAGDDLGERGALA